MLSRGSEGAPSDTIRDPETHLLQSIGSASQREVATRGVSTTSSERGWRRRKNMRFDPSARVFGWSNGGEVFAILLRDRKGGSEGGRTGERKGIGGVLCLVTCRT